MRRRPVFAETVGQHAIRGRRSSQLENVTTDSLQGAQCLDTHLFRGGVAQTDLDGRVKLLLVDAQVVNQVRFIAQAAAGDPQLAAGAKDILEAGLTDRMPRVVARAQPPAIDLGAGARLQYGRSIRKTDRVRVLLCADAERQPLVGELLANTGRGCQSAGEGEQSQRVQVDAARTEDSHGRWTRCSDCSCPADFFAPNVRVRSGTVNRRAQLPGASVKVWPRVDTAFTSVHTASPGRRLSARRAS